MKTFTENDYYDYYESIRIKSEELLPYYDIDKVKPYSIYVWTKGENGMNVFDITDEGIDLYEKEHVVIKEALPIINELKIKIQVLYEIGLEVFGKK